MTFKAKLSHAQKTNDSWLCVGLDPVMERLPQAVLTADNPFFDFGYAIVEATTDLACAYKPNLGFWLAEGPDGLKALQDLIAEIPDSIPVILDGIVQRHRPHRRRLRPGRLQDPGRRRRHRQPILGDGRHTSLPG